MWRWLEARLPWLRRRRRPLAGPLEIVATARGEADAELMCQRLAAAGIAAMQQRAIGSVEMGPGGARNVFVPQHELEHAREVLGLDGAETGVADDGRNGAAHG